MDQLINEIFASYQVRKSKKQKTAFIDYTTQKAREAGWKVRVEKGGFGVRNLVLGDPDKAKVIYTAHYDTCARLPFPNFLTPKNIGLYLLYTLAVCLGICAVLFVLGFVIGLLGALLKFDPAIAAPIEYIVFIALYFLLLFGPANKHTANDNTSGVTVLFGIMKALPAEQREQVALVFFDHEESGLIGSSSFAAKHKTVKKNSLLVNFDCVSDGENLLIVAKKKAKQYNKLLSAAYQSSELLQVELTDKAFYPSDQAQFKAGVGVAAFKKTCSGILYMNRIHTNRDTVYRRENIDFLIDGSVRLSEMMAAHMEPVA